MSMLNALAVWQQIPVANRTVEVNTKTGFSLTAGSYVVTGTVVRGTIAIANAATNTAAISAVTLAKTQCAHSGQHSNIGGGDASIFEIMVELTSTTVVTATRDSVAATASTVAYEVCPLV